MGYTEIMVRNYRVEIILTTNSSDEHWNGDIDFALVCIDEDLAKRILTRQKLLVEANKSDYQIRELHCSDAWVRYYFQSEEAENVFGDDHMVVLLDGVYWSTFVNNTNLRITTCIVPYNIIESCL